MDDLISRAAAIEGIDAMLRYYDEKTSPLHRRILTDIREGLNEIPAVDAVPVVHAWPVWINPLNPDAKICTWKCSSLCSACGDYVAVSWKYCPNCGAKMDGERRDNE